MGVNMIKLKSLLSEEHDEIDVDRLFWNESYLDKVCEQYGYETDFTKKFWSMHYIPTLYHCTTEDNYSKIKIEGLKRMDINRGAVSGNRSVGDAVFTTSESEEISFFKHYYGPIVISINAQQMKNDGFTPDVSKEPDWERAEKLQFVFQQLEKDMDASRFVDSSDQNTQSTIIVYSDIPTKYLSVIEYD